MTFLQTCLDLLSSENSTHTPQSSLQGTEWSEIISKYVLSNSKNKSMNITSNAIVYICSTGRPRDTSLTDLGRVGWKYSFSSNIFVWNLPGVTVVEKPAVAVVVAHFNLVWHRVPGITIAWLHFGLVLVGFSGSGQLSILTSIMMGFQCRLIMKLPSEEIALRVASTDILTLTHQ